MIKENNDYILKIKRLRGREYRLKAGLTIAEGYPEVKRAQKAGGIKRIFVSPQLISIQPEEFDPTLLSFVSKDEFAQVAFGHRLKGIIAICQPRHYTFDDLRLELNAMVVVIDSIEKPGNLGTIIRSADGAGASAVLMCDQKTDVYNHNVVRASLGTVFHIPIVECKKEDAHDFLKRNNFQVICATPKAEGLYTECDYNKRSAVIIGNEHDGVRPYWMDYATKKIRIPMLGESSSLNAAMSASIILYEALRQKNGNYPPSRCDMADNPAKLPNESFGAKQGKTKRYHGLFPLGLHEQK